MIRNDDYFEIIKEQNKELAKFRPFKSAYEMKKEIERLKEENNNLKFTPKTRFKDVIELREENKRLNNIINELEYWLRKNLSIEEKQDLQIVLNKLEQLKHKKIYESVDSEILYYDELGSDKE